MRVAVQRLREGELVGVYPEATISRSFELKGFKTGAARMAGEAGVPIIPMIVWGAQRIWTKDHPRQIGRNNIPITVRVGKPLRATEEIPRTDAALRESMIDAAASGTRGLPAPARRVLGAAPAWRWGTDPGRGGSDRGRRGRCQGRRPYPPPVTQGAVGEDGTAMAIRLSELQERLQKYGTDGVTPPGKDQSGLH